MIQQLQDILHNRAMTRIEEQAVAIAKTLKPVYLLIEDAAANIKERYRQVGIQIWFDGGAGAYIRNGFTVDTNNEYYQKVLSEVTTQFERELEEYHKVTDSLAGVIVESEHPQAESQESES